ncbi:unnamed protein product [Choristocarpus tenellus]
MKNSFKFLKPKIHDSVVKVRRSECQSLRVLRLVDFCRGILANVTCLLWFMSQFARVLLHGILYWVILLEVYLCLRRRRVDDAHSIDDVQTALYFRICYHPESPGRESEDALL